tara:strand:- start:2433 stop:3113 length:681 start_codon:yes stop_codon:yes gene_type:complete
MKQVVGGIIIGIILTWLILLLCCKGNDNNTKVEYIYKTDTLYIDKPFEVHDTLIKVTPPKYITYYKDTGSYHNITVEKVDTNLLVRIHELEDSIHIHEKFLKKHPFASKLLELELRKDSLRLTTMNITSQVESKIYPIDLNFYQYQYSDNTLRHDSLKQSKSPRKNSNVKRSLLIGGSYSILQKTPLVHLEYPINYRRVRLSIESTASLETTPNLNIYLKALYKIK